MFCWAILQPLAGRYLAVLQWTRKRFPNLSERDNDAFHHTFAIDKIDTLPTNFEGVAFLVQAVKLTTRKYSLLFVPILNQLKPRWNYKFAIFIPIFSISFHYNHVSNNSTCSRGRRLCVDIFVWESSYSCLHQPSIVIDYRNHVMRTILIGMDRNPIPRRWGKERQPTIIVAPVQ